MALLFRSPFPYSTSNNHFLRSKGPSYYQLFIVKACNFKASYKKIPFLELNQKNKSLKKSKTYSLFIYYNHLRIFIVPDIIDIDIRLVSAYLI